MKWTFGEQKGLGIRICGDCGTVTLEDEMHLCLRKDNMVSAEFELVEAEWPDKVPAASKAIKDFLSSALDTAEIRGEKDFLINVRRTAKAKPEFRDKVELRMVDNRMFIRRVKEATAAAAE